MAASEFSKLCEACGREFRYCASRERRGAVRFCSQSCCLSQARALRWARHKKDVEERLNHFRIKRGVFECWGWTGFRFRGYGRFSIGNRIVGAHRAAFELARGPIPEGKAVRHTCDNRDCTNPAHLILGTVLDNNRDRDRRGRQAKGERQGSAKLTEAHVMEARRSEESNAEIAARFGCNKNTIASARNGTTWAHLPGAISRKLPWQVERELGLNEGGNGR